MPEGWEWDETLYAGSAEYYERGRVPYAPGLAGAVARLLPPGGPGRLLDVGCGPGTLTLLLADLFTEAVGVDPDPGMLAEARRRAAATGRSRVRFVQARAENLPAGLGTFQVATFGQSFHWMDRDLVAATVHGMLSPGGLFVQVSDVKTAPAGTGPLPAPPSPYPQIRDLVRAYLGPGRRAGQGLLRQGTPGNEAQVLARHGFRGPHRIAVPAGEILVRGADELIAWVYSRSDSAPHLFGERRPEFEADLRRLLKEQSPSGRFAEHRPDTELFVWRRP